MGKIAALPQGACRMPVAARFWERIRPPRVTRKTAEGREYVGGCSLTVPCWWHDLIICPIKTHPELQYYECGDMCGLECAFKCNRFGLLGCAGCPCKGGDSCKR